MTFALNDYQLKQKFMFMIECQAKYNACLEFLPILNEDICLEKDIEKRLQMIDTLSKSMYFLGMLQGYLQVLARLGNDYEQFKKTEEAKKHYHYCYNNMIENLIDEQEEK